MTHVYINGTGIISPQETFDTALFLENPVIPVSNRLRCVEPVYREFIPAEMIRRMGRVIKMGVAASKCCLKDAGTGDGSGVALEIIPEMIITGTGLGCVEDTEKFLTSMIVNREEFLTPTSFIQSTHNTVAGQIALLLKCHGYNFTYVHRGISFESALIDAMTQLQTGAVSNVLAGATDELTNHSFAITSRMGYWKQKLVGTTGLLNDPRRGSIAGEGASFFFLENQQVPNTYAELRGIATMLRPESLQEIRNRLHSFLGTFGLTAGDISVVLLGLNGDPRHDRIYRDLARSEFDGVPQAFYKHLCGEYHTASSFAMWLGSKIIKRQHVPPVTMLNHAPGSIEHVLIYNHFRENNHAFILLSRP